LELEDIFIGKAQKYNHFTEAPKCDEGHSCVTCLRRQFSFPYTCKDGWKEDRGKRCMNWTDDPKAPVD